MSQLRHTPGSFLAWTGVADSCLASQLPPGPTVQSQHVPADPVHWKPGSYTNITTVKYHRLGEAQVIQQQKFISHGPGAWDFWAQGTSTAAFCWGLSSWLVGTFSWFSRGADLVSPASLIRALILSWQPHLPDCLPKGPHLQNHLGVRDST